jgi:integrase/recombinase XerC
MVLTSERFNLDDTVPEPNAPRFTGTQERWVLPPDFPFLIDDETGEVVAPVLLYLRDRYNAPSCYRDGAWKKQDSADAAVSDLKDWWSKLDQCDTTWDRADDALLAEWLLDMKTIVSGRTKDFLAEATVARRGANICSFYQWAFGKGLVEKALEISSSRRLARAKLAGSTKRSQFGLERSSPDEDPHPISAKHEGLIASAMGPLPSEIADKWMPDPRHQESGGRKSPDRKEPTSRDRLAYELGFNCGIRIDEILNLPAQIFEGFQCGEKDVYRSFELRLTHTKGLRPREIFIPYWLMCELADYVANERRIAIGEARRLWLKDRPPPWQLLLNGPGAGRHVGKPARAETIETRFSEACVELGLVRDRIKARGTTEAHVASEVRHRFHDTRHTFAVTYFRSLEAKGVHRPWIRIQKLLGHASVSTTISIYLNVIDSFGPETLEKLHRTFSEMRGRPTTDEPGAEGPRGDQR